MSMQKKVRKDLANALILALFAGYSVGSVGEETTETTIRIPKNILSQQLDDGHVEYIITGVEFKPDCRLEPPAPLADPVRGKYRWTDEQRIEQERIEEEHRNFEMKTEYCRELP